MYNCPLTNVSPFHECFSFLFRNICILFKCHFRLCQFSISSPLLYSILEFLFQSVSFVALSSPLVCFRSRFLSVRCISFFSVSLYIYSVCFLLVLHLAILMCTWILLCHFCFHVTSYLTRTSVPAAASPFPPSHLLVFFFLDYLIPWQVCCFLHSY
jgi:hypothetical protein